MNIAQKCTFCAHLLDDGWKEPRCVDACPTDALRFGEEEEMKKFLDQGGFEIYKPEENTKPRVYYKGLLNKFFVAGAVWDPAEDECLENCTVTLTAADGGKKSPANRRVRRFLVRTEPAGKILPAGGKRRLSTSPVRRYRCQQRMSMSAISSSIKRLLQFWNLFDKWSRLFLA